MQSAVHLGLGDRSLCSSGGDKTGDPCPRGRREGLSVLSETQLGHDRWRNVPGLLENHGRVHCQLRIGCASGCHRKAQLTFLMIVFMPQGLECTPGSPQSSWPRTPQLVGLLLQERRLTGELSALAPNPAATSTVHDGLLCASLLSGRGTLQRRKPLCQPLHSAARVQVT